MTYTFHGVKEAAKNAVLAQYGFNKEAAFDWNSLFTPAQIGPRAPGVMGALRHAGSHVQEMGRKAVFGNPFEMAQQIHGHIDTAGGNTAKGLMNFWKGHYWQKPNIDLSKGLKANAGGLLHGGLQAFNLANIARSGYQAATTEDPDERKRAMTRFGVGLATAPFTANLGIPGALAGMALTRGAERLVAGPRKAPVRPMQYAQQSLPPDYLSRAPADVYAQQYRRRPGQPGYDGRY